MRLVPKTGAGNPLRSPIRLGTLSRLSLHPGDSLRTTWSFGRFCSASGIAACHFPGQVFEGVGLEHRLVELAPLEVGHLGERRISDDLPDGGG
jgi:hypothetical protein